MNCKVLSARSNCRAWRSECLAGTPPWAAFMSAAQLTPSASPVSMNGRIAPITGNTTPSARAASPFSSNSSETTSICGSRNVPFMATGVLAVSTLASFG